MELRGERKKSFKEYFIKSEPDSSDSDVSDTDYCPDGEMEQNENDEIGNNSNSFILDSSNDGFDDVIAPSSDELPDIDFEHDMTLDNYSDFEMESDDEKPKDASTDDDDDDDDDDNADSENIPTCPVCYKSILKVKLLWCLDCGHLECGKCYKKMKKSSCPLCRKHVQHKRKVLFG